MCRCHSSEASAGPALASKPRDGERRIYGAHGVGRRRIRQGGIHTRCSPRPAPVDVRDLHLRQIGKTFVGGIGDRSPVMEATSVVWNCARHPVDDLPIAARSRASATPSRRPNQVRREWSHPEVSRSRHAARARVERTGFGAALEHEGQSLGQVADPRLSQPNAEPPRGNCETNRTRRHRA